MQEFEHYDYLDKMLIDKSPSLKQSDLIGITSVNRSSVVAKAGGNKLPVVYEDQIGEEDHVLTEKSMQASGIFNSHKFLLSYDIGPSVNKS